MIKISKYHLLSIFALSITYLIGKGTEKTLIWMSLFIVLEIFVLISLIRSKYESKKFFYFNIVLFVMHLLCGLIITYVNLAMDVGANSLIYR